MSIYLYNPVSHRFHETGDLYIGSFFIDGIDIAHLAAYFIDKHPILLRDCCLTHT